MRNKIDKAIDDVHLDHIVLLLVNVVRAFRVQRFHFGLHLFFKCPKQKHVQKYGHHQEENVIKRDINALEDIKSFTLVIVCCLAQLIIVSLIGKRPKRHVYLV